jgi:hypothetical protein
MKKVTLSILAALAIGNSSLYAEETGLYLGLGYSNTNVEFGISSDLFDADIFDVSTDSLLMLVGYDINEYIGVEGRYYWNITSMAVDYHVSGIPIIEEYKAESFALYVKPQYSFDMISIYALLGITMNDYTALLQSSDDTLFSWGVGAKFNMTQSFGVFADYTDLGETDDLISTGLSSWNLGISYKF